MPRCPLCKTAYPPGTAACKIDGTKLSEPDDILTAPSIPSLAPRDSRPPSQVAREVGAALARPSIPNSPSARGKGASLASMTDDEVTAAAQPSALSARARGDSPPRIATGSGTVAPESQERDAWSQPFLDVTPKGLDSKKPETWIGETLGTYKLVSILGKGGMGCVYRAEHEKLGREVALKVLRADYAERKDAVARFFQEARAVNKIRHRNIVDITDFVELDTGIVFIIMEYLDGAPLTKLMRSKTGVDPVRALGLLIQICDGLAAAHSVGIVHRDLKPDNIMIAKDHRGADLVKLLDFGVAKLLDKNEEDEIGLQTVAGSVVGTPAFMSPEQAGGSEVDGRADLYSLGAIMYEMFTKQPLFRGKSFGEFVRKHLNETPTRPTLTKAGKDMHPRAEEVILQCLEKDPDKRFQTAQELRTELLSLLATIETSGEMTSQLKQVQPTSGPTGAARPRNAPPGQPYDANIPSYYEIPGTGQPSRELGPAVNEVLVSSSPSAQSNLRSGTRNPTHPSSPGTEPPLSSPSNLIQPPVAAMNHTPPASMSGPLHLGYPSNASAPYPILGQSAVREPTKKNLRGVGIAVGICLVALLALVIRSAVSGDDAGTESEADDLAASSTDTTLDPSSSDSTAPTTDALPDPDNTTGEPTVKPLEIIKVAMSSEPSAQVFAVGAVSPVCTTPCDVEIDANDGGSRIRRDFILRTEGFSDATVTIDLEAPRETVFTALDALPDPIEPETKVPDPIEPETKTPDPGTKQVRTNKAGTNKNTAKNKNTGRNKNSDKDKNTEKDKPKCKAGAQDTFNPFGDNSNCR